MTTGAEVHGASAVRRDELSAVHGARWFTVAFLVIGVGNYGYALLLTHLLSVDAYARFAAGQGLLLAAATVAMVSVPWVLAKSLARARSEAERADAVRFAVVIATGGGIVVSAVVAAVAAQFADATTVLVLASVTMLIYVTRVTIGWLQGTERMRTLAAVDIGEVVLKTAAGLLLVGVVGLSDAGALAAFGAGLLPLLIWWPRLRGGGGRRSWRRATADRDLWRRSLGMARLQGMVALLLAVDQVLVTLLPGDRAAVASYQASVVLARVPLFVATALATAFFPALSRRKAGSPLAAGAVRMYVIVALPLAAVMATAPGALLAAVFPTGYRSIGTYLAFTAIAGFAIGGVSLLVTFAQAADDFRCARRQVVGVLCYLLGLLVGWRLGGVPGFAAGAAVGGLAALGLLALRFRRQHGGRVLAGSQLVEPLLCAGLLALLSPRPVLWLAAAAAVGIRASVRFLRHHVASDPPVADSAVPSATPATAAATAEVPAVAGAAAETAPGRPPAADDGADAAPPAPPARPGPAYPFQLTDGRTEPADFWHEVSTADRLPADGLPADGLPGYLLFGGQDRPEGDPDRALEVLCWMPRSASGLTVPPGTADGRTLRVAPLGRYAWRALRPPGRPGIWVPRGPGGTFHPAGRSTGPGAARWLLLPDRGALGRTDLETLRTVAGTRLHLPPVVAGTRRMWTR